LSFHQADAVMEIGATSSTSYLPPQLAEPRAARVTVARDGTTLQDGGLTAARNRNVGPEQRNPQIALLPAATRPQSGNGIEAEVARSAGSERDRPAAGFLDEARASGESESPRQPVEVTAAGGSIKMDVDDGDRVMQVYDSKDVLIYQMPPKGALMLIKAQENAQQSQLKTSA
jgi:hypothetical protein